MTKQEMLDEKNIKNYTTEEIVEAKKNNEETLLKTKTKLYKYNTLNGICGLTATFGLGVFAFAPQPVLKLTSLCLTMIPTCFSIWLMGSKKYRIIQAEYNATKNIEDLLEDELYSRLNENQEMDI